MSIRQQDIADQLGLSVSTVSLALRDSPQIAEETRAQVYAAAVALGYLQRPRQSAHTPIQQIAFITHANSNTQFFSAVLSGAEAECQRHNIAMHFSKIEAPTAQLLRRFAQSDALLLAGALDAAAVLKLKALGKPTVLLGNNLPHLGLDRVLTENVGGMYASVVELARWGHRRIAMLSGEETIASYRDRRLGYLRAMADLGLEPIEIHGADTPLGANRERLAAYLHSHTTLPFTALVVYNDPAAVVALQALQEHGLRVPADVSVIGFDDVEIALLSRPTLTTRHVHREMLGTWAVRRLLERVEQPDLPTTALLLDTLFVERESARPLVSPVLTS
jgi:DNA-binding LacI/PurR family transcriptional regulator